MFSEKSAVGGHRTAAEGFFSGWPITRVQIVRKQYYGSRSLISAFITLDSRDSVDRMVEMMNGRSYAALTPTFVQAERAVPRMKDLQAMYVPPGAEPKMRPRPKVQAEPLLHPAMEEFRQRKQSLQRRQRQRSMQMHRRRRSHPRLRSILAAASDQSIGRGRDQAGGAGDRAGGAGERAVEGAVARQAGKIRRHRLLMSELPLASCKQCGVTGPRGGSHIRF